MASHSSCYPNKFIFYGCSTFNFSRYCVLLAVTFGLHGPSENVTVGFYCTYAYTIFAGDNLSVEHCVLYCRWDLHHHGNNFPFVWICRTPTLGRVCTNPWNQLHWDTWTTGRKRLQHGPLSGHRRGRDSRESKVRPGLSD